MVNSILKYALLWVFLVLIQVLLLNHIQLSGYINPYMYVMFILLLPFETPKYLMLILGFLLGLNIDIFSNTLGMHACATTFMAFARPFVIDLISSRDTLEINSPPRLMQMGLPWFLKYTIILVVVHHIILFYIEAFTFEDFIFTFFRSMLSSVFTIFLIILSQYLIYRE